MNPEAQLNKFIAALKASETDIYIKTWSSFCFTMIWQFCAINNIVKKIHALVLRILVLCNVCGKVRKGDPSVWQAPKH